MNTLTRMLNMVGLATRQQLLRMKRGAANFTGARLSRLTSDWVTQVLHIDQQLRYDLTVLKARCRDLARNSWIGKRFIEVSQNNVVGSRGIRMQMNVVDRVNNGKVVPDTLANIKIEEAWKEWSAAKNCTVTGKLSLIQVENLVVQDLQQDGESIIRLVKNWKRNRFRFSLQPIDNNLLDVNLNRARSEGVNEIRMGVELDQWGAPINYYFKKSLKNMATISTFSDTTVASNHNVVPASEILHIYKIQQAEQTRGVPPMAAVLLPMKMLDGYQEAELTAARAGAAKMGFLTTPSGNEYTGAQGSTPGSVVQELEPGSLEELPEGWKFEGFDPTHPTTAYPSFVKAMLKSIASGLGVSYVSLASDLEGVNYSSIRAGVLDEREQWKKLQGIIIEQFMRPVFEAWLETVLLAQAVQLPATRIEKFNAATFMGRRWPWVDPLKDMQAAVLALANQLTSRTRVLNEVGEDFEETVDQLVLEANMAKEKGIQLTTTLMQNTEGGAEDEPQPTAQS